jgi:hypothetical protein
MSVAGRLSFAVALFTATICTGALAQTRANLESRVAAGVEKVQKACSADVQKYCGSVTHGEGRLLLCMQAHEDQVSAGCDLAIFEASRNLQRALHRIELVADACWNDIEKHCANITPAEGRVVQCLVEKKSSLSPVCGRLIGRAASAKQ